MGIFDGTLLASDMDGTLLNSAHEVSCENAEAIDFITKNGGRFTIATGRMIPAITLYAQELAINAPIIALNGAVVYDIETRTILRSRPLGIDVKHLVRELAGAFPKLGIEVVMADKMFVCRGSEVSRMHCQIIQVPYVLTEVEAVSGECMKLNLTQSPDFLDEVEAYMNLHHKCSFYIVHSDPHYLEVLHADANKGWGLNAVAEIIGIRREHVYAVGDNYNDVEMLRNAGFSFAPANAEEQVKNVARVVVSSNDNHAVRDVMIHMRKMLETTKITW